MAKKKKPPAKASAKSLLAASAGAPVGNRNAEKLKTPEERKEAYRLYCIHIAAGYSGNSFYEPVTEDTMLATISRYPNELDLDKLAKAKAQGRLVWEQIGFQGTIGKLKGFNAFSWKFNMQNRLGWKEKHETGFDKDTRAVFRLRMGKDLGKKPDGDEG